MRPGVRSWVVLNKWEIMTAEQKERTEYQLRTRLSFLGDASVMRTSALTGKGVHRILPALGEAISAYRTRVPTRKVNEVIRMAQQAQPAPHGARILYGMQGATDPPTFTLFTNKEIGTSYMRYIERMLREQCSLGSTPDRLAGSSTRRLIRRSRGRPWSFLAA
jgi:GTP-binding protein